VGLALCDAEVATILGLGAW